MDTAASLRSDYPQTCQEARGIFGLPAELREIIYQLVVTKDTNTITMLFHGQRGDGDISADQPAISRVNRQLRAETLATYYGSNVFSAQVDNPADLGTAQRWLHAIGDVNVGRLRRLALCGFAKVPFGHMASRRRFRIVFDLHNGITESEEEGGTQHPEIVKRVERIEWGFQEIFRARQAWSYKSDDVGRLMDMVATFCTAY